MRFRRMAWEPIWEMSAAMFALAILLIAAFWLGLVTAGPRGLFGWQHRLMLPAVVSAGTAWLPAGPTGESQTSADERRICGDLRRKLHLYNTV
jgi:hypothetical protein